MYKTVNFNIYKENLETVVFAESKKQEKIEQEKKDVTDKPIPKPPPQYWTDPLIYRRSNRESEGTNRVL